MSQETLKFDAEVGKILQLMIHSLYTHKEIFLRELISNASDACDKLRYLAVTNPGIMQGDSTLKVQISSDENAGTLTISDNGIGMNRQDLIEHLGTIAKSGTQGFLNQLTGDSKKDMQLIGQFGVGFYSSFMVSDEVVVESKKAGETQTFSWSSKGDGEFIIGEGSSDLLRGTKITLHIKEDCKEFLDKHRIRHIVTTYSDHISIPIEFIDGEKNEVLNSAAALWTKPKSEITEEQYNQFYKHVAHAGDVPWMVLHNKNEGNIEYTNLLYIPSRKPFDLFHPDRKARVKLYVKKVYITEDGVQLVPAYLRFVKGIVDSEDLPLNISRETLQHNTVIDKIRKSISKRVTAELKKKMESDKEDYQKFWENFGEVLKEGLCEGIDTDREALFEVCRFGVALSDSMISLDDYIAGMKEGQEFIYYITASSLDLAKNSPQLEGFVKRGINVLILTDTVDEFWVNVAHQYKDKEFKSVTKVSNDLDNIELINDSDDKQPTDLDDMNGLIEKIKSVLGEKLKDARISSKLVDSPVCLGVSENSMDIRMERFLIHQKQMSGVSAKILEINAKHPIIKKLALDVKAGTETEELAEVIKLLFDQACIIEGEPIDDAGAFSRRLNRFLVKAVAA